MFIFYDKPIENSQVKEKYYLKINCIFKIINDKYIKFNTIN